MTPNEFCKFSEDVAKYYGKFKAGKIVDIDQGRVDLWYDECHRVPGPALEWIKSHIFKAHEYMPPNLPKAVSAGWYAWQADHPKKIIGDNVECDAEGCENGWLFVTRPDKVYPNTGHRVVFLCDRCAVNRHLTKQGDRLLSNVDVLRVEGWSLRTTGPHHGYTSKEEALAAIARLTQKMGGKPRIPDDVPF